MKRMLRRKRDPIENDMEVALCPGVFIWHRACYSFASSLGEVGAGIDALLETDSTRAAGLYETFLAGCRWVEARQAAGTVADETAAMPLDQAGLAAFERVIRLRLDATQAEEQYDRRRWVSVLRAIYWALRNPAAYREPAERSGLKAKDGLGGSGHRAGRRVRLRLRGPGGTRPVATRFAHEAGVKNPSNFSSDNLMKPVPEAERAEWRAKALDAARGGGLHSLLELFTEAKEAERRAQAMRIAVANLERARRCYLRAGLDAEWVKTVGQIWADRYRKKGFMAAFERVAKGVAFREPPSFLERAKDRWKVEGGGSVS